ncbi:hypothetical protein BZJ19_05135 [Salinivibrio proteolyticus]|uniref:hypothetical protein n=1 Tax=Salinivibrio proteolyticus TaxID=334715 RepID=UPI000988A03A|nr:hypothetical protein [Salinivibrio proteolyticus]OOF26510.1 hypothetical protein BZJ19_05135 [Salinivibrio proteolyticus]
MAAEKLTKGRLAQILVMLTLLVSAFVWRTLFYSPGLTSIDCDDGKGVCGTSHSPKLVTYQWRQGKGNLIFSLISDRKPHSAYWSTQGKQTLEIPQTVTETDTGYQVTWQWKSKNKQVGYEEFVVVIDQYQFKFNYLKDTE